jgi:hypothetical protein
VVLNRTEENIDGQEHQRSSANPSSPLSPQQANNPRDEEDSREDQINDKGKVPGVSMIGERGKDHRSIRGEEVEKHMADEDQKTDFVITPEMRSPCDFSKKPTEKERIKWEKEERVGEVPMVLEIELRVNETEDKVHVGKEPRHQARCRSPGLNFLVLYRFANDCPCERMRQTIHRFMVTRPQPLRQMH